VDPAPVDLRQYGAEWIHIEVERPRQAHTAVEPDAANMECAIKGMIGSADAQILERASNSCR